MLSSQIACGTKPNRITKITQQSNVADFNIFIIIIIREKFFSMLSSVRRDFHIWGRIFLFNTEKDFLFSSPPLFLYPHSSTTSTKQQHTKKCLSCLSCFSMLLSQKIFHYDGSINPGGVARARYRAFTLFHSERISPH